MVLKRSLVIIVVVFGSYGLALGQDVEMKSDVGFEPVQGNPFIQNCVTKRSCLYTPKPKPCTGTALFCGCDRYCPKPPPCTVPVTCHDCNRYCPKPLPRVGCPPMKTNSAHSWWFLK